MRAWRTVLFKASIATVLSIAASLTLAATVVPALGGVVDGNAWLMCALCPLLIAFPASAWQFRQAERLRMAHAEIARLHGELAQAHHALTTAHAELLERARRDGMTGLLNRESFLDGLAAALVVEPPGVLLLIDADHFKQINDRFGHPVGDAALRAIAGVIGQVADADGLAGRIGGEEFAVYLAETGLADAAPVAERIRRMVAELRLTSGDGEPVPLSVSIGGALQGDATTLAQLVAEADRQLYKAKRRGRDRVALAPAAREAA